MIRVAKIVVVDGEEVQISAEAQLAGQALEIVNAAAELFGAAPGAVSGAPHGAGKRQRRTKAEMEAARAAVASVPLTSQLALPATTSGAPTTAKLPFPPGATLADVARDPLPGPMPPAEPMRAFGPPADAVPGATTQVEWNQAALIVPQDGKTVAFDGPAPPLPGESLAPMPPEPAPPAKSPEDILREAIDAALKRTIALKPEWEKSVLQSYHTAAGPHGGDIFRMGEAALRDVLAGVERYEARVVEALKNR